MQVLAESEQMRKEADDTGPLAELEHWRFLMAKFNSLLEHMKGDECKAAISTLHAAKSKVLKVGACAIRSCHKQNGVGLVCCSHGERWMPR